MTIVVKRLQSRRNTPIGIRAFSRRELLAVVAALGLMGVIGIAGLRQWQHRAARLACANNLRQLAQGFQAFAVEDGRFPEAARLNKPKAKDWVFWQPDRDFKQSGVAAYCPTWKPDALRCPLDDRFSMRAFKFSFAMNGHSERRRRTELGPGGQILLAEQHQPNDGCWAAGLGEEPLTRCHQGAANAAFDDGHVQLLQTDFSRGEW